MDTDVILSPAVPMTAGSPQVSPNRISWNAVLAGTVVAIATWMTLQLLGVAIGLTAVDLDSSSSMRSLAIGNGVWAIVAPVLAFFAGGLVAGRANHAASRLGNAVAGIVMWSVATVAGLIVLGMVISAVVGGAVSAGADAAGAAGGAVGKVVSGAVSQADGVDDLGRAFGIRASDALQPVNQRLRAEGKPAITPQQLEAAVKDIVGDAVRAGKLDRAMLVRSIADQTALSNADAQQIAARVEAQYDKARAEVEAKLAEAKAKARDAGEAAADATGKALLTLFGALILAMLASVGGSIVGGKRYAHSPPAREATARVRG